MADDARFRLPAYGTAALSDVVPAIARAVGQPIQESSPLELEDAAAYVVFLVDGLGLRLLEQHADMAPFLSDLLRPGTRLTAGVPTTTATSLTSLSTGLLPGTHGVVGYLSRVPGTNDLLNALQWDRDVDPRDWQPHRTAFGRLRATGCDVTVVNKREFEGSGLTTAAQRGADFVGADRVGERIAAAVAAAGRGPSLTYLYDGDLDWTGHRYGVASHHWQAQLAMIDAQAEQLREELPPHVRLLVLADHGMVDADPATQVDVDVRTDLRDGVTLFGGEARFRQLYCARGAHDDVVAAWREAMGSTAVVVTRDEAVDEGWFGPLDAGVVPRIGDVLVACRDRASVVASVEMAYEARLVGMHGSLTDEEMLVPLLVD
ncbi:alkaline phosphatase family protein [Nocardioides bruguierae]|uniref:Alkaline phosphatase family protein n=1 Tax=Nocardioides bruguierae TaxID=2945102 RepID=A0A9X2ICK1_9ACTN|nr:nucleotide pyrophosphatase/phosphodiesterase family protein [Nocardioides bruguierae]MCM0618801.1 alkaline phosphatase family protein [Nocardioides bruguierae]